MVQEDIEDSLISMVGKSRLDDTKQLDRITVVCDVQELATLEKVLEQVKLQ